MNKIFIYSARIARDLISKEYKIIDIAENQKDKKRTVFVFEGSNNLVEYLKKRHNIEITL